jgi:hypothetical protein
MMMVLRSTRSTGDINLTVAGAMRLNFILPAITYVGIIHVLCKKPLSNAHSIFKKV